MPARNPVISVRLSDLTRKQIDELTAVMGCSMADLITILVDRVYQKEVVKQEPVIGMIVTGGPHKQE